MPMPGFMLQFKAWFESLFRKRWCLLIICSLCTILGITLYDTSNQAVNWGPEPIDSSGLHVGSFQIEIDNPWRAAQTGGFREVLIPNNIGFIYHELESFSVQRQLENIRRLIREGVDYLVIVPADLSALTSVLQDAKDTGIPVILIGQSAETIDRSYYIFLIPTDYLKERQIYVDLLADRFADQPYSIMEIYGTESSPGVQARSKGFHRALIQYPNMEIIDVEYENSDRVTTQETMENTLIKAANRGQTIDAVLAHSDEDGLGALQVTRVTGLPPGKTSIVSISGIRDMYKTVIVGEYLDTVENNPHWGFITAFLIQQMEQDCKPLPMAVIPYQIITVENVTGYALTAYQQ